MLGGTYKGVQEYKRKANKIKIKRFYVLTFIILGVLSFLVTITILKRSDNKELKINNDFIELIKDEALETYENYGILPSVTISQAILESNWGNSTLASKYNNLFGIKADERWNGERVNFETNENYDDIVYSDFRAYDSFEESIKDYGKFLYENSRYRENGLFDSKDYKNQTKALEKAGYATVKNEKGEAIYSELLIKVIEENNLYYYDKMVVKK